MGGRGRRERKKEEREDREEEEGCRGTVKCEKGRVGVYVCRYTVDGIYSWNMND